MLETILPESIAVVETRVDVDESLFLEERIFMARAVEGRRREFTTSRACARAALMQLGWRPRAIPAGPRGDPHWPVGIVGSITHCDGYRAAAVGRVTDFVAIGIDAEPKSTAT